MNDVDLTAFCGLYCGDCIRYRSRASELAGELLKEIDRHHLSEYADIKRTQVQEFAGFEPFVALLKAIAAFKCEVPCRLGGDGCGGACEIVGCVKAKGYEGCWQCDGFERCAKFDFLKPFHGDACLKNLIRIRGLGLEKWAKHREKCYPWLQRR